MLVASLSDRGKGDTEEALLDMVKPALNELLGQAHMLPVTPQKTEAPRPFSPRRALWLAGGGVLVGAGAAVLGAVLLAGASAVVAAYDVAAGWRPGQPHALTATQGLLADGVLGAAVVVAGAGILGVAVAGLVFGMSGVVS